MRRMRFRLPALVAAACLTGGLPVLTATPALAAPTAGVTGSVEAPVDFGVADFRSIPTTSVPNAVAYPPALPAPAPAAPAAPAEAAPAPASATTADPEPAPVPDATAPGGVIDFAALGDNGSTYPPDTHGAVGPSHVMTTLNSEVRIQDRTGANLATRTLLNFWSSGLSGITDVFDPRITYDPYGQRFVTTAVAQRSSAASSVLVAVSGSNDPTGSWYFWRMDADSTDTMWADFPSLGFNTSWVAININLFTIGGGFNRSKTWVLPRATLYTGPATFTIKTYDHSGNGATLTPATTYSSTEPTLYFLQSYNGNSGGLGWVRIYTLTGGVGTETFTNGSFISTSDTWAGSADPNLGPQQGSTQRIHLGYDRTSVVFRNGSIWAAQTVFLPATGPTRAAIQWWQVDPATATATQRARIDDATGTTMYAYPSIAVNADNDVLIGYSRFSATTYGSAAYSFRYGTDPANTIGASTLLKAGEAVWNRTDGAGRNRWGDYSATVVDPTNDHDLWTIQEYAAPQVGGVSRWGTWWGRIAPTAGVVRMQAEKASYGGVCGDGQAQSEHGTASGATVVFLGGSGCAITFTAPATTRVDRVRWYGGGMAGSICGYFQVVVAGVEKARTGRTCSTGGTTDDFRVATFPSHEVPVGGFQLVWQAESSWLDAHVDWIETPGPLGTPGVSVSPASIDFGVQRTATTSGSSTVTVSSTGTAALSISSATFGGTNAADFSKFSDGCTGASVTPGAACTIQVRFTPGGAGSRSASLSIVTNAGTRTVSLSGRGDGAAPTSSWGTANNAVVLRTQSVNGASSDDVAGVSSVQVTYSATGLSPQTVTATLSCNSTRTSCSWVAGLPTVPGQYTARAVASDLVGRVESPGPAITITVV